MSAHDEVSELAYALSKQIPDMKGRGFVIGTSYGELEVSVEDAQDIAQAVEAMLRRKHAAALRRHQEGA